MISELFLWVWGVMTPMMVGWWLVYRKVIRNAVLADVGFCVGFGVVAMVLGIVSEGDVGHRMVVAGMGAIYGLRLGGYLLFTRVLSTQEDPRYGSIRKALGQKAEGWIFVYFLGQALAIAVFSIPLIVLMNNPQENWSAWEIGGVVIWMVGVVGESLSDYQLYAFRRQAQNKGKTCRQGLWRYSRHPNYFFDSVHWCAYVIMGVGRPYGWLTLIGPVVMIGALLKGSGIPLAENQALKSRGEDYRDYQRTTSAFIPWFPRQGKC